MPDVLAARFAVLAEAERAATQLRGAGVRDEDVSIASDDRGPSRQTEVGVPDDGASLAGLGGADVEPPVPTRMIVRLEHARMGRDEIAAIIHAAGGRTE